MTITVVSSWMEHSGGTKFYQVFRIQDDEMSSKAATVGHYGPMSAAKTGRGSRPLVGGQTIVKRGSNAYQDLINAKTRRGYSASAGQPRHKYETVEKFREYLTMTFSAGDRHAIEEALGLHGEREIVPKGPADTSISEPEAPRPDGWGDW